MTPEKIRQIVREEISRSNNSSRFQLNTIPNHTHNGVDSLPIRAENIIPASSIVGTVSFEEVGTYRLNLNAFFTPQRIDVNGILTGTSQITSQTARVTTTGFALLTPSFYLEENDPDETAGTANLVVDTLDIQFPFKGKPAQGSSYLWTAKSGSNNEAFAGISRDHIVSVYTDPDDDDTIRARATVTEFSKTFILIDVPILVSGWKIILNLVIT